MGFSCAHPKALQTTPNETRINKIGLSVNLKVRGSGEGEKIRRKRTMATQQTLFANNFLWIPSKPLTNTNIPSFSLNPQQPELKCKRRFSSHGCSRVKCSSTDYNIYNGEVNYENRSRGASKYPRPAEIEWKKELCNSVQLIGNVGTPVQTKQLPSGNTVGWCRLGVKKSPTDTDWFNLTFWGESALVASEHIEKGDRIFVSGRLVSDVVESDDGNLQTFYKIIVRQMNFVEKSFSRAYDEDSSSATLGRNFNSRAVFSTASIEELWQAYFANPAEWWDNRNNKRSPNYPDFKHKDTGESLWIDGKNNPSWVKSQLSILDTKMESYQNQTAGRRTDFVASDFSPY